MRTIIGDKYRITILTDRLIRLEYSENGAFEDRKSFAVVNRSFHEVSAKVDEGEEQIVAETDCLVLTYDRQVFSSQGLSIRVKETDAVWTYGDNYGDFSNLYGTARTLDNADGPIALEKGIFGRNGYAVLDDSTTPVLEGDEFVNRTDAGVDLYFFGYADDYYGGLKDFYTLCGRTPMIPRYALGNWWSRYYKYTEESYLEVLNNFEKENIPLSVAVIDMDWHITEVDPKYGTGWTGYSWNKDFFPDYKRFLKALHNRKLATTLNLHPADGIRAFEDMYEEMAEKLGIDPKTEQPAEFDFGDPKFRKAYFDVVMNPYEEDGVDFWWIDWQQGTGKKGQVDPLILLNHYHYLDQEKRNVRPMIFSRYAGPGSHRYPVGFSGDTHATWKSLEYQPFFTATASNIGYGWWSHDIGGHMLGDKNLERLVRWIQFGVFSPVMRIHSSSSPFFNKEPWQLPQPYRQVVTDFMRLRHEMIPYLYSENRRAYAESKPLIRPMYYDYSEIEESYSVGNQYKFGENLLVFNITAPEDSSLKLGCSRGIIPEGRWIDILNGRIYNGTKVRKLYRNIDKIPVLMPAGGIVPLSSNIEENGTDNPRDLRILVGAGAGGSYTLYEDDGKSMDYESGAYVETAFSTEYDSKAGTVNFRIAPVTGDKSLIPTVIPQYRNYTVEFLGMKGKAEDGESFDGIKTTVILENVDALLGATITLDAVELLSNDYKSLVFDILENAWIKTIEKDIVFDKLNRLSKEQFASWLRGADIAETLKDAIEEVL